MAVSSKRPTTRTGAKAPRRSGRSTSKKPTYSQVVDRWESERLSLRSVQPYTARKAAQKALLFAPWIGNTDVATIEARAITQALIELGQHGGRKNEGLSSTTLRAAHLAGTQVLEWAIGHDLAATNPFKQVQRPKIDSKPAQYLTMAQAHRLASYMASNARLNMREGKASHASFCLAVCIALATGLRRGEIFALEWDDLDTEHLRLSVSKAIKADGSLGMPKSFCGVRSVAIGQGLAKLLTETRTWQQENLPQKTWPDPQCIMCNKHGDRASLNAFEHWWRAWTDGNSLTGLRFHELRHTHATLLIANGTDVKTVQMRLGHSSADITMSCYAHAIPLSDGPAAASLDTSLFV